MEQIAQRTRVGAYVVCVRDGALLLVRFAGERKWTLPGGGIDHGEDPRDAAVREFAEETGHTIELGPLIGVDSARWETDGDPPVDMHHLRILYKGEIVGGELRHELEGSTDRAEWVPLSEVDARDCSRMIRIGLAAAGEARHDPRS